jgi:hypothetical protein
VTRHFERLVPWAVAALAALVWLVPLQLGFYADNIITDVPVYREVFDEIAGGGVPYRDFDLEYPPLAAAIFWLAGVLPGSYSVGFSALMLGCLIATALSVVATARAMDTTPLRRLGAGVAVAISPLLLGGMVQTRYDLALTAAHSIQPRAAVTRRFRLMWTLLAVAVLIKLVPLALLPVLIIWQRHHRHIGAALRGAAASLAGIAAVMLPFALLAPEGTWGLVRYHLDRPLQIESSGAAYLLGLHALADIPLTVENSFGSQGLAGRGPAAIAGLSTAVLLGLLAAIAWSLLVGLRRARPPGDARLFMAASCATVVALLVAGKVLSPQFMLWLLPVAFLVTGRYGRAAFGIAVVAMLLTLAYFPHMYWDLVALDTWPIALLVMRDAALIALLAACWPRPSIARRPRGWMLRGESPDPGHAERAVAARYLAD